MATRRIIRVLCVDDHDFLYEGLSARLALEPDMECVGHLPKADDLIQEIGKSTPHVVLLDIEMPGADPFEAIDNVRRHYPEVKVVMLSAYVRDSYVDAAFENGACGYFVKSDPPSDVIEGIRKVMRGEYVLSPDVMARVEVSRSRRNGATDADKLRSKLQLLTPRELQILRLIGKGLSRAEIAQQLYRSRKTIDVHNSHIMKKTGIHNRLALMRFAIQEGLVEV